MQKKNLGGLLLLFLKHGLKKNNGSFFQALYPEYYLCCYQFGKGEGPSRWVWIMVIPTGSHFQGAVLWIQLLTTHLHPFWPHCARKLHVMADSLIHVLSLAEPNTQVPICSVLTLKLPLCSFLWVVAESLAIIISHGNCDAARYESVLDFQWLCFGVMEISGTLGEFYGKALTLMSLWHTGSDRVIEMLLITVMWSLHKVYRTDMIAGFGVVF